MKEALEGFVTVAHIAGIDIGNGHISIRDLGCPHLPKGLPADKMGIYTFSFHNEYLKIGKAGPNSDARFRSQHYSPKSSQSNLAKSILNDPEMHIFNLNDHTVGAWIKEHTRRIDILIDSSLGIFVLNLLEAYLHCKYKPKYEGFENQNNKEAK